MFRAVATGLLFLSLTHSVARAADAPKAKPAELVQGTWLFDEATLKKRSELGRVWASVVTIKGDTFTLTKLMGSKNDLKGTFALDPANPMAVDFKFAELDLSELLPDYKISAGTLPGIYKIDGDRLTLCFPRDYKGKRPTAFAATADQFLVTLARAPKDFKEFPKEVKVTVIGANGKPVAGALVCQHMSHREDPKAKKPAGWEYYDSLTCGADGTVVLSTEKMHGGPLIATTAAKDALGIVTTSPAKLAAGAFRVELQQQVRVTGTLTCDELTKEGQPIGWTGGYLLHNGTPVAFYSSKDGKYEFLAPPGKYTLNVYGSEVDGRFVDVTVPENRSEFTVEAIAMEALAFARMKGKPAPELAGIVAWSGAKTTFADLKGKYVLVEFWGYWCGPCVHSMPELIAIHEKYADKGLAIVGVHVDIDGEVDSTTKLNDKIKDIQKDLWKGKSLPFPSALASGTRVGTGDDAKRSGPVAQYGIRGFPTCLLIDRDGKLVGEFNPRDPKDATARLDELLAEKK